MSQNPHPHYVPQNGPAQRTYSEGAFAPSDTQALRVRHRVQQYEGGPVDAPWTTQAIDTRRAQDPSASGDLVRLIVGAILGLVLLLGFGGLLLYFFLVSGSVQLVMVALSLSLVPLVVIILLVIWFDRWKRQPIIALVLSVMWGGVAAVIMTLVIRTPFDYYFASSSDQVMVVAAEILGTVAVAPILEEITKGLFLIIIVLAARRWLEGPLDGWVYGSLLGAGFAFTENILYLQNAYISGFLTTGSTEEATKSLLLTFIMRCIMSPFLHSTFVVCAGISIGMAARQKAWWVVVLAWIPGLLLGMILHAGWNGTSIVLGFLLAIIMEVWQVSPELLTWIVLGSMSALVTLAWFGSGLYLQRNEAKQTRANLGDYANAGWLTHAEVEMLGTFKGRRSGKKWAKRYPGAAAHMKVMIKDAADLATTRMRLVAGVGGAGERKREKFLLEDFATSRRQMMQAVARASARPARPQGYMGQPGSQHPHTPTPPQPTYGHGQQGQHGFAPGHPVHSTQQGYSQQNQPGHGQGSQGPGRY